VKQVVTAPAIAPSARGLLQTVRPVTGDDLHWQGGFSFSPNGCITAALIDPQCGRATDDLITPSDIPIVVDYVPNAVVIAATCNALSGSAASELGARVRSMMEAAQGPPIEQELWRGDRALADSLPNFFLAGGSPNFQNLTPGASDAIPGFYALSALQAALAECNNGARGMIHAPRQVVTMWQRFNVVRIEGSVMLDAYDNWIVAGAGYDGSDPDGEVDATGNTMWAYATGLVDVRLGEVNTVPGTGVLAEALDRGDNSLTWQANRFTGATWDGCCHAGARVNVCDTCCDPDAAGS